MTAAILTLARAAVAVRQALSRPAAGRRNVAITALRVAPPRRLVCHWSRVADGRLVCHWEAISDEAAAVAPQRRVDRAA